MKSVIVTGKNVEEATLAAAIQLAVPRNQLVIEVLEEPVKGILGVFGRQDAKIKASVMRSMGDIARDFLTTLFQKMNLEASVDVTETDDTISVQVEGPNMGILIGHRGETLDAVQYLTSLVVNKDSDNYKKVIIDTENYRSKEETLRKLAKRLAHKVAKTKRKIVLEPMNPFSGGSFIPPCRKTPK